MKNTFCSLNIEGKLLSINHHQIITCILNAAYNNSFQIVTNEQFKYINNRYNSCSVNLKNKITSITIK